MEVGPDLRSLRSWRELGGKRFEAEYGADAITITTTDADGKTATKTLKPPAAAVDNDVSLQAQRALPLAAGYVAGYTDVIPTTGSLAPVRLTVTAWGNDCRAGWDLPRVACGDGLRQRQT